MRKQAPNISKASQQGVVLLEAMIAILIFSVGVLALVGLQAAMVKNTSDSKYRADASYIAQQRIGTIWSDFTLAVSAATYEEANTDISTLLPSGRRTVTSVVIPNGKQFTVTVTWQSSGDVQHNFTTIANITGG